MCEYASVRVRDACVRACVFVGMESNVLGKNQMKKYKHCVNIYACMCVHVRAPWECVRVRVFVEVMVCVQAPWQFTPPPPPPQRREQ